VSSSFQRIQAGGPESGNRLASRNRRDLDGGKLLALVIVLTILEGAFRKWVFPSSAALRYAMYFSKDAVFFLAALAGSSALTNSQRKLANWMVLATGLLILPASLVNIGNTSAVGAFLSLRAYTLVPLCAILAAPTVRSMRRVDQIAILVGVAAIAEVALGIVQFRLPNSHWLNRYDSTSSVGATLGHVRATGTFSYIGGMVTMGAAAAWAGIYLFLSRTDVASRAFAGAVLIAGLASALLAMSRTGTLMWGITVAGGVLCFRRGRELAILGVLAFLVYMVFNEGLEGSQESDVYRVAMKRFTTSDSVGHRTTYFFNDMYNGVTEYPFGIGLGVGQPGGNVSETNPNGGARGLENEPARIVQEVGVPGLVGVFFIRLLPFGFILPRWRKCKDRRLLALYAATIPFLFVGAFTNLAFNHTLSSIYWCVVALVVGAAELPNLNQEIGGKAFTGRQIANGSVWAATSR
jgi:hypothetical protein